MTLRFISGQAIALLQFTRQLLAITLKLAQVVVGELPLLLLHLSLDLVPGAFDSIVIHGLPPH